MDTPEGSPDSPPAEKRSGVGLPSWKSVIEFVTAMADVRRTVDGLKGSNRSLREDVARLQRQVDEQTGQLKVLLGFVQNSLDDQIDRRASRAAAELFSQLISLRADASADDEESRTRKR
jgi:hypothetical protein